MAEQTKALDERHKTMIEEALKTWGYEPREWYVDDDGDTCAKLGRFEVIEGDNDEPPYLHAQGELTASVVGAQKYNNERVYFSFKEDDMDVGDEVRDLSAIEPIAEV